MSTGMDCTNPATLAWMSISWYARNSAVRRDRSGEVAAFRLARRGHDGGAARAGFRLSARLLPAEEVPADQTHDEQDGGKDADI